MYTFFFFFFIKKKRESAVPDLQMVLGIVYCFSLQASIKPTWTAHILEAQVSHTHLSQKRETDGVTVTATLWL